MKYCPIRKRIYRTKKRALTAKARAEKSLGRSLNIYKCPLCHKWHLTKQMEVSYDIGALAPKPRRRP